MNSFQRRKKKFKEKNIMHSYSERMMMIVWRLLCLIFCLSNSILVMASPAKHLCLPDQRDALWEFKNEFLIQRSESDIDLFDPPTEKWRNSTDCCSWYGVSCDPNTRNVIGLELGNSYLNGPLRSNSSLFKLQHLLVLDLSSNNFLGLLPDSIGNLKHLRELDLSYCNFFGKVPSSLTSLSHLTSLVLSENDFTTDFNLVLLNMSSSLTYIDFRSNQYKGTLPSNMSSLSKLWFLDISENSFFGTIPSSLFLIPTLHTLHLEKNNFNGPLEIGNISAHSKIRYFFMGENSFNGPIPRSISKLVGLLGLSLSFWNTEKGIVDFSLFLRLKSLSFLDLSYLNTRSLVDFSIFSHLKSLQSLQLSGNSLKISSNLHLPSPLQLLVLSSCNITEFPEFLKNQTSLYFLDISANQIQGQVPKWLWRLQELYYVNIAKNSFSGEITKLPTSIGVFIASDNQFSGEISRTICDLVYLQTLVLSNNNFSGSVPLCFENLNILEIFHLRNNSLSGVFPEESITSSNLTSLDVGHNMLSGQLPKSLINCTLLEFLNVEDNRINDTFPLWLGLLPNLQILVLRSNLFHGPLLSSPREDDSSTFPELRIFDISKNSFSGVLSSDFFACWRAMSSVVNKVIDSTTLTGVTGDTRESYHKFVVLTNKGLNMELVGSVFKIYKTIDVSGNRFQGDIPGSISLLKGLIVLNMSNNAFTGYIPQGLSNLTSLQSLDLSQNILSGSIPTELGTLTFLAVMNLSYNRLEGVIPQGTQIQSQNSSSFAENPGLCGAPLLKKCGEEATKQEEDEDDDEEKEEKVQVMISWVAVAIAYVPGVLCGLTIAHFLTS